MNMFRVLHISSPLSSTVACEHPLLAGVHSVNVVMILQGFRFCANSCTLSIEDIGSAWDDSRVIPNNL